MSDAFLSASREDRNVLERLVKGLPGIKDYADLELRRNADYRLRQMIADELDTQRNGLLAAQNQMLKGGGLAFLDDLDTAVNRVQLLAEKVRTAAYGYAGLFDAVRVREEQLDALHRFDVAMLQSVAGLDAAATSLREKLGDSNAVGGAIDAVVAEVDRLAQLFDRRGRAILSPDLLTAAGYAPETRTSEGGMYDLSPVEPDAPAAPAAPQPPSGSMVDAGNYTLQPTGEPPVTPAGTGDVPSGFELIDKP